LSDHVPFAFESLRIDENGMEASFRTRNSTPIHCRLIQPDDAPILIDLFTHLSPDSRRRRFNSSLENLQPERVSLEAQRLAAVDNRTVGGAILAFAEKEGQTELVAVARLGRMPHEPNSPQAEAAVVVRDDFQRLGVATRLMLLLGLLARRMNVVHLTASIQADNQPLLSLLRRLQLPLERHTSHGETTISLPVAALPAATLED
jgi:acetyltransferase